MSKVKISDLVVVRQYYIDGINLLLKVDLVKRSASFVEPTNNGTYGFVPKKWLFAERETDYLKTWVVIHKAMAKATELVIEELEGIKESELKRTIKALAEMSKL